MNYLVVSLLALAPAFSVRGEEARTLRFDCQTSKRFYDGRGFRLRFQVAYSGDPSGAVDVVYPDEDDSLLPVRVYPPHPVIEGINENLEVDLTSDRLVLAGDAAGFYLVTLGLFKNSGFKRGYLRIEDRAQSVKNAYGKVSCQVK